MKEYVAGFLFDIAKTKVVLIEKRRPTWQAGKLNGVGGKIETGESPHDAMLREFSEETGLTVLSWSRVLLLRGRDWRVHFFRAFGVPDATETTTDERVGVFRTAQLPDNVLPNLRWLIPMCLDDDLVYPIVISDMSR